MSGITCVVSIECVPFDVWYMGIGSLPSFQSLDPQPSVVFEKTPHHRQILDPTK